MFKKSSVILLVAGLVTVFAVVCKFSSASPDIVENYWDTGYGGMGFAIENACVSPNGDYFVDVPADYSNSTPIYNRPGSPEGFGANINYNPPAAGNMAFQPGETNPYSESFPMRAANSVEQTSCGSRNVRENFANKNIPLGAAESLVSTGALPTSDMKCGAGAKVPNTFCSARPYVTLTQTRNYTQGDWIRGDLPVVPNQVGPNGAWFQSTLNPSNSLMTGAMNVLGGPNNETANLTTSLKIKANATGALFPAGGTTVPTAGTNTYAGRVQSTLASINQAQAKESYSQGINYS